MRNEIAAQSGAPTLADIGNFIARVRRASRAACRKQGEARRAHEGRAVTDEAFGPGGAFEALTKRPVLH